MNPTDIRPMTPADFDGAMAIFILKDNPGARRFWQRVGFAPEDIIDVHSMVV